MSMPKLAAALGLVVAIAFAVPALAGTASPIKVAKKALGLAKKADTRSKTALKTANSANATANAALTKANAPVTVTDVAHATNADHAAGADALKGLTVLGRVKATPTSGADEAGAMAAAPEIPLFSQGPLRVYAKCLTWNDGNQNVEALTYIGTSQNGVIFGAAGGADSGNAYINTDTPEQQRRLTDQDSSDNVPSLNSGPGLGGFYAFAPDGSVLQGEVYVAAKQGDPAVGNGPIGPGSGCIFTGRAFGS